MILLDTCVVSEMRKTEANPRVVAWFAAQPEDALYLCAITVGEIERGIHLLDDGRRRLALTTWLDALIERFDGRILPVDTAAARRWGAVSAVCVKRGRPRPPVDAMIAAVALEHGATLATRNVHDFLDTDARLVDPWAA